MPGGLEDQSWRLDYATDELANGRRLHILTVIPIHSCENLALEADASVPARRIMEVLKKIVAQRSVPHLLRVDLLARREHVDG